jgi:hypothetical protein
MALYISAIYHRKLREKKKNMSFQVHLPLDSNKHPSSSLLITLSATSLVLKMTKASPI